MKNLITMIALSLAAGFAMPQTSTVAPPIDRGCQPMRGAANIGLRVATEPAAAKVIEDWSKADSRHLAAPATTNFYTECRKQYVAKTTPKPPDPTASGPALPVIINAALTPDVTKLQNPVGGWPDFQLKPATSQPTPSDNPGFRTACQTSKFASDDPLVFPGQPGRSHTHSFIGNTGIDAYTTTESLIATGNSTCRGGTINKSALWVPSMVDTRTGAVLAPMGEIPVYYKCKWTLPCNTIQPFPQGLRFIVGDPNGSPTAPSSAVLYACVWNGGRNNSNWSKSIPKDCPLSGESWLIMSVDAQQCWDGANLDSPDHRSHMAAAISGGANNTGRCPASHPVPIPGISVQYDYKLKAAGDTAFWRLSSDNYDLGKPAGHSGHLDYWAAWAPGFIDTFVKNCINKGVDCGSSLLGDGREMVVP
jgi:hypothetical protein